MDEITTNGTALSLLRDLPTDRKTSDSFIYDAIQSVKNGTFNPIETFARCKIITDTFKAIQEAPSVRESFITEFEKYGERKLEKFGCEIDVQYRKSYEFKDVILDELNKELESIKAQIKAREMLLKTGMNSETGEIFSEPIIKSSPAIKITFK
jgi:hypothetical protein